MNIDVIEHLFLQIFCIHLDELNQLTIYLEETIKYKKSFHFASLTKIINGIR